MRKSEELDMISQLKTKKKAFNGTLNMISDFLRDWCGVEYTYSSALLSFMDKTGNLARLEKINHEPIQDCLKILKNHISLSQNTHYQLSKTLEMISVREISRLKLEFKDSYHKLIEACYICEQDYRSKLTNYAAFLVDSKENEENILVSQIETAKKSMKEIQERNTNVLSEIKHKLNIKMFEIEEHIKEKITDIIIGRNKKPKSSQDPEEILDKILGNQQSVNRILEEWLTPRISNIFIEIEKFFENTDEYTEKLSGFIENCVQGIIEELKDKCRNSSEYWEGYIESFIRDICLKIAGITEFPLNNVKKQESPSLMYLLGQGVDSCVIEFSKYVKGTQKPNWEVMNKVIVRINVLYEFLGSVESIVENFKNAEDLLKTCNAILENSLIKVADLLAYVIIRGEFSYIFISLYEPYTATYFLTIMRDYYQRLSEQLPLSVFSDVLKSSFGYFLESWKFAVMKTKSSKSSEERTQELKNDLKSISIFFEAKQNDSSIQGVPREVQKVQLQKQFNCISLAINSSQDLVKRFQSASSSKERKDIAWIIIARGEKANIKVLIQNKSMLV
ncbi:hypothetical protein SteCoe_26060 [Stentor coeruleus]|uniref:Uncharacterized protein n=1 Tax=Stentor coeruleus TaxID=5963 RepID=A0A1R2BDS9_9CILI|nr:hypothetical protein SteCoe_26060 [Stentor coeruleus]